MNVHEAGAIEWGGHKVLALPSEEGKLTAYAIDHYVSDFFADDNWEHMYIQAWSTFPSRPNGAPSIPKKS